MSRKFDWHPWMLDYLRLFYAIDPNQQLQKTIGCGYNVLTAKAKELGLSKQTDGTFLPGRRRSPGTEFKPGLVPWNKGVKGWQAGGRSAETRFKPGRKPEESRNYLPIGSLRITRDGLLERKVTDDQTIVPARRWVTVHRLVWEQEHGPVPTGFIVIFKDGQKTTDPDKITIDRLQLVSRAENMRRNSHYNNYPKEVSRLIQLQGALTRQINKHKETRP